MEQGGLVFVLSPVLFLDIAQGLRHVKFHIDVDLGVGALIHQMGHDGVKPVQITDPVGIRPVTPSFCPFFHNSLPFCHAKASQNKKCAFPAPLRGNRNAARKLHALAFCIL